MHSAVETESSPWEFSCDLEVDYKAEEKANIIYSSLAVDKEVGAGGQNLPLSIEGNVKHGPYRFSLKEMGIVANFVRVY
ncbi:hypothetical protein Tco_1512739 [Tanacetum coccineum]